MVKTVGIFHGYGGNKPGTWLTWLATVLKERGYNTIYPSFPFMGSSTIEDWSEEFKRYYLPDEPITLVGHSGGTTFAFYVAQHMDVWIDKMILVAPLNDTEGAEFGLTSRPGKEAENPFLRNFIHQNFDFDVIKSKVGEFVFMLSDNDHLIPHDQTMDYFKNIFPDAKFITLPNYGHVNEKAGITEMPGVLEEITESFVKNLAEEAKKLREAVDVAVKDELYAAYGRAVYHSQGVERLLHSVYVLVYDTEPEKINADTFTILLEIPNRENLGELIYKLKSKVRIGSLERQLNEALEVRNFLIHEYFWKRSSEMETNKGRIEIIKELVDYSNQFALLCKRLENILFKWTLQTMAGDKDIEPFLIESEMFDVLESDK